jgi:hypothetical protein
LKSHSNEPGRLSAPGRILVIMAVTALTIVTIAWAVGLFDVKTSGKIEAPNAAANGGQVPVVRGEPADARVGA